MPVGTPNVFPFMRFADAEGAFEWLSQVCGFTERAVYGGDEGTVHHAEMEVT